MINDIGNSINSDDDIVVIIYNHDLAIVKGTDIPKNFNQFVIIPKQLLMLLLLMLWILISGGYSEKGTFFGFRFYFYIFFASSRDCLKTVGCTVILKRV